MTQFNIIKEIMWLNIRWALQVLICLGILHHHFVHFAGTKGVYENILHLMQWEDIYSNYDQRTLFYL